MVAMADNKNRTIESILLIVNIEFLRFEVKTDAFDYFQVLSEPLLRFQDFLLAFVGAELPDKSYWAMVVLLGIHTARG